MKRSGAATVGAVVLSSLLTGNVNAEIETWKTSDGTSVSLDVDKEITWCFIVKKDPFDFNPNKVEKEYDVKVNKSDEIDFTAWTNKDKYTGSSAQFPDNIDIANYFVSEIEDAVYDNLIVASRFIATGPENGEHMSVTFGGNARAHIFEEDGIITGDHDVFATADSSVSGATWTIDKKTGVITLPEASQCVNTTASTVGNGSAKFSVTLGQSIGTVVLGCNYLDGNVEWSVFGEGSGNSSGEKEGGGSGTVGGTIECKKFNWEGMNLRFLWNVKKLRTEIWTSKISGKVVRIIPTEIDITEAERAFAEEDDYAEPQ